TPPRRPRIMHDMPAAWAAPVVVRPTGRRQRLTENPWISQGIRHFPDRNGGVASAIGPRLALTRRDTTTSGDPIPQHPRRTPTGSGLLRRFAHSHPQDPHRRHPPVRTRTTLGSTALF